MRFRTDYLFSPTELDILHKESKLLNFPDFRTLHNVRLHQIAEHFSNGNVLGCNECEKDRRIRYEIPAHLREQLFEIAKANCTDVSTIARRLIVDPLFVSYLLKQMGH